MQLAAVQEDLGDQYFVCVRARARVHASPSDFAAKSDDASQSAVCLCRGRPEITAGRDKRF